MSQATNTKLNIVCIGPGYTKENRTRTTSFYELVGYIADSQLETPATIEGAESNRDAAFSEDAGKDLTRAVTQAKALHDLLSFYPDESEASGQGERFDILKHHYEKHGPLSYATVYYLLRCALSGTYTKVARKQGTQSIKNHPQQKRREAFMEWAAAHIQRGETPRNIAAIKRLSGFDKTWGTDDTIKKWWRGIENAPALKPGATRT